MASKPNKASKPIDVEVPEEDEEESEEEQEEEEPATVTKRKELAKRHLTNDSDDDDDDDDEEESAPTKTSKKTVKGKASSLAKAWNSVPLTNNAQDVPDGRHEAIISEVSINDPTDKGQFAFFKYELCEEEFAGKNTLTSGYKLLNDEGKVIDFPLRRFKQDLAKLGYEPETLEDTEDCIKEINEEKPGVLISVSYQKDYPDFPRIKIEGLCENEIIEAYKDNVPY
jgi:hypothetical protein